MAQELAGEGDDTIITNLSYTLPANVENLVGIGGYFYQLTFTGNNLNNTIIGRQNFLTDTFDGGLGADTFIADGGTFIVDNPNDKIVLRMAYSQNIVQSYVDWTLQSGIQKLTLMGNNPTTGRGSAQNNILDGSVNLAANTLIGGAGDDTYIVGSGDLAQENLGEGWDTLQIASGLVGTYLLPANIENLTLLSEAGASNITGDAGDNFLLGNQYSNTILGGDGNDVINGGSGFDLLDGGAGDDIYSDGGRGDVYQFAYGSGRDQILYFNGGYSGGTDRIQLGGGISAADLTLTRLGDTLILELPTTGDRLQIDNYFAGSGAFDGVASLVNLKFADGTEWSATDIASRMPGNAVSISEGADIVIGTPLADMLATLGGDDRVAGADGDDSIDLGDGNDQAVGGAGNDQINGGAGNDLLLGSTGNDQLLGGAGDDRLLGEAGNDVLNGGAGEDALSGGAGDDWLTAGAGDYEYLDGGAGADTYYFARGDGIDIVVDNGDPLGVANIVQFAPGILVTDVTKQQAGDDLLLTINGTTDQLWIFGFFSTDYGSIELIKFADGTVWSRAQVINALSAIVGTNAAETLNGTAGNNRIYGMGGNDTLNGYEGDDLLDGGTGTDTMRGGLGDDTYMVDASGDVVTESANQGSDTVNSSVIYTLGSNVENLMLTGSSAINGTGNTLSNTITGNSANNTLNGGTGADTLIGGLGNDTYVVDNIGDVVTENTNEGADTIQSSITYTLGANVENLTLTGTAIINGTGNELSNILIGNSAGNSLYGLAGDDSLNGGTGADKLFGGIGNDTYTVDNTGDVVTENAGEGTDSVQSSITYTLGANVENLTLTGTSAINGTGNTLDNLLIGNSAVNTLTGNAGNDTLDGGAGGDTMVGGTGDDTYVVDNTADKVTEAASAGTDTVQSRITHTLSANVEALILTGTTAINGTDNTLNNLLIGNTAVNTLTAGTGNDILQGGDGNDILKDTAGNNLLAGGAGTDTLTGASGRELFIGGTGNDTINTGSGYDILAFNRGDGVDTVALSSGQDNTISLGGGIRNTDLTLRKASNDLILDTGNSDSIVFKDWYTAAANKSVLTLQMIEEASIDFAPGGGNTLTDNKVEQFNFAGLVTQFDQARVANPALTSWALSNALLTFYLGGSDTAAIGGDLAYQYGKTGSLSNIGLTSAQSMLGNAQFGQVNQAINQPGLGDGLVRLSA